MKICCKTLFDITHTGITGHYRPARGEFVDRAGQTIKDQRSWDRARNQQRNWETLTQLISLRTQVDLSSPLYKNKSWKFEFEFEAENLFWKDNDPVGILKDDCNGVPMLLGLTEKDTLQPFLVTNGPGQNIWFETITINS
jgi:hypothetical protein